MGPDDGNGVVQFYINTENNLDGYEYTKQCRTFEMGKKLRNRVSSFNSRELVG